MQNTGHAQLVTNLEPTPTRPAAPLQITEPHIYKPSVRGPYPEQLAKGKVTEPPVYLPDVLKAGAIGFGLAVLVCLVVIRFRSR